MFRTLVLLALIALPLPVMAEEPYETVVHGRAADERRPADDPAGHSTVLRVKDPPAGTDLATLVERVPGLRVRDSGPGGRKALSLRGADSQQALVLLDGIPLSSVAGGGVDLSLLDPAHLERIEVRRGGSSARFGSAALGGVVSLSTPRLRMRRRTSTSLSYGSFNQLAVRGSHAGAGWRRWRYLASGSYRQGDGDFPYIHHINRTAHMRDNNAFRQGELLLKTDYLVSDRWQVGALDDLAIGERGAPGVLDSPCSTARQQDLRNLAALRATRYDLLLDGSKLDLSLSHRLGRYHFRDPCAFNQASFTEGHNVGLISRLALPLGDTGRMDAGIELSEELLVDRMSAAEQMIPDGQADRFTAGFWASSSTRLFDDLIVVTPAVRLVVATGFGATVVPKAGLALRPLRWTANRYLRALAFVGNIGRSFRHPSLHELYVDMDSLRGNAELSPEDALDGDVGLRWELSSVMVELAYFRRFIRNLILYAPVSAYLVEAGNYPSVETEGAEGALRLTPGFGLDLRAAYTFTKTGWDEPVVSLPGHPEHRLVTRLAWEYPWRKSRKARWRIKLWTAVTYESGMPLDRANSIEVGRRVLLSAGGSFNYRWLTLAAKGRNLLDRRDMLDSLGFPLPPARFLVSLSGAL